MPRSSSNLPTTGLTSLYLVSLVFGLSQGGIVPSYAYHRPRNTSLRARGRRPRGLRHHGHHPRHGAGRLAFGADLSTLTGSYRWAFLNGIAFNALTWASCC